MRVTKLEYQKNDPNRVNVFIDGEFAVGVDAGEILNFKLYKDKEITQDELNKIVEQSEFGKMLNFAINYISFRPRSEYEVKMHLKRKFGIDSGAAQNDTIERLKKNNLIDDLKFAQWFVDQRNTFRPKSARILNQELRIKGVKPDVVKQVLADDKTSEFEKAWGLVSKKFQIKDQKIKEKISHFLLARGFNWDTVKDVLARLKIKSYNEDG